MLHMYSLFTPYEAGIRAASSSYFFSVPSFLTLCFSYFIIPFNARFEPGVRDQGARPRYPKQNHYEMLFFL